MNTLNELMIKVAIEKINYESDILYTYKVPEAFEKLVSVGKRVIVPFGRGSARRKGIVIEFSGKEDYDIKKIKSIITVLDEAPFINEKMLELALWMKNNYFCSLYDAASLMLPSNIDGKPEIFYVINKDYKLDSGISLSLEQEEIIKKIKSSGGKINKDTLAGKPNEKELNNIINSLINLGLICEEVLPIRSIGEKLFKVVSTNNSLDITGIKLTDKQKKVYNFVKDSKEVSIKEICYFLGVSACVVEGLAKKNILNIKYEKAYKGPTPREYENQGSNDYVLSNEQSKAYDKLKSLFESESYNVSLLHGVTGSGKTAVFVNIIDHALKLNKNVIMMVPEISLTTQMVGLFKERYGENVSILHSGLSKLQRFDEWKKIKEGKAKIAVGTRSAVFAPFDEVGLIILDEEQEYTYKSESSPRFHARDVAKFRCKKSSGLLILASATPSLESYYFANKGKYSLCTLNERYGKAKLPNVRVVDMNAEVAEGNTSQFSRAMIDALKENIKKKKQSILFLNRRGYHTFAKCRECEEILNCPNCNVSLTYHLDNNRLMCHYCGYSREFSRKCNNCGKDEVYYTGVGTQKAEEELKRFIPEIKVLRIDADTTQRKHSHEKLFSEFKSGEYDVMIGTQMIAKGLNFSNVTLVGIVLADKSLYQDDFRSYERAFSMMTQVIGRSGRGDFKGTAIIQTFTPENSIIDLAAKQDYVGFYKSEIEMRKLMLYPPFVDLCVIGFTGTNERKTLNAALRFFSEIKKLASEKYSKLPLRMFKPAEASINKVGGKYRVRIIIKCRNNLAFRDMISEMLIINKEKIKNNSVDVFVDINPDTIL